jgi:TolB protein
VDPPRAADAPGIPASLVFVDVASGAVRSERPVQLSELFVNQVLPYFDQYALSHRVWSPDGTSILLPLVAGDGTGSLAIIPADGSEPRILAPGSMGFWSP